MLFKFSTKPSSDDEQGEAQSSDQQDPSSSSSSSEQYNVFRDSPVRYLGYANEVGESFRYQVSSKLAGENVYHARDDLPLTKLLFV